MTPKPFKTRRPDRLFAAAVFGAMLLAGGVAAPVAPAHAQATTAPQGVAPWQAKRAIEDYINRFIVAQNNYGKAKFGSRDFSVRVKVEGLTRIENKDLGTMWVAQFSGAILPTVSNANAQQGYAHGILKIYFDKAKGVQVVVNEGQGIWTMTQKTSILFNDLPPRHGGWKDWGGPGDPPEPPNETATPNQFQTPPPPTNLGGPRNPATDPKLQALGAKVRALGAKVAELKKQNRIGELQAAQEAWQAAQKEYMEEAQRPR